MIWINTFLYMVVEITRDNRIVTIVPDNVVHMVRSPYCNETPWGCVMSSGDIVYITEEEKVLVDEALRLRDEQINQLIENTATIITELGTLNSTASSINSNTANTANNTGTTATNSASILAQTKANGTLLGQIKSVCDNILAWVKNR